jgi:hypothetical protein
MTEESHRPHGEPARHQDVDDERHAHPGEPRRPSTCEHDTTSREPVPHFSSHHAIREARGVARDRY